MANTKTFPYTHLIEPNRTSYRLLTYSSPPSNISATSNDPLLRNKTKVFNRLSPEVPYVPSITRLEWSPSFGVYIYWTDGPNFGSNEYFMSYDEFGGVDKASVISASPGDDSYCRFGQYSSIYGFNLYPNLQNLYFWNNRNLKSVDLSGVNSLKSFSVYGCDLGEGINFSNLSQLEYLQILASSINSISLPMQPNIAYIGIEGCFNLESINIPGSGSIDGTIYIDYNFSLSSITVPLNTTNDLQWYDNALTNVNVSGSPLIETMDIGENFLTSLNFDGCPYLKYIYASGNIFSTQTVDNLFISASNAADTYNLNDGNIYLNGANGLPSDVSLAARNNLISRNWNVGFAEYEPLYYSPTSTDPNISAWTYTTASNGAGNGTDPTVYTDGSYTWTTPNIKTLSVNGLSEIDGRFYLDSDDATRQTLESVNFDDLPNLSDNNDGELYITYCRKLTSINVTNCPSVTDAYFYYNDALVLLNLSGSTNITRLEVSNDFSLTNLDLSQLPNLQYFDGYNTFNITSYDFTHNPLLTYIQVGSGGGGQLLSNLESVDCSGLSGLTFLNVSSNPKLTSLNLSGSNALETIYMNEGCGLTYIDLSTQTSLNYINANNSKFSSIDLPVTDTLTDVRLSNNQLTAGEVNKVLNLLASGSGSNGYVSLDGIFISGVIQNAIPDTTSGGYDGVAAIDTLLGRGWTVYYNV